MRMSSSLSRSVTRFLRAASAYFYQLRWSDEILDEMERYLVVSTGTMPFDKAARLRAHMEGAFPEAQVTGLRAAHCGDAKRREGIDTSSRLP
jgi:hypothetical protein